MVFSYYICVGVVCGSSRQAVERYAQDGRGILRSQRSRQVVNKDLVSVPPHPHHYCFPSLCIPILSSSRTDKVYDGQQNPTAVY